MKRRIVSAVIGLSVLICVLIFFDTVVLNISISVVSAIAVYELFKCMRYLSFTGLFIVYEATAVGVPLLWGVENSEGIIWLLSFLVAAVSFVFLLKRHNAANIFKFSFLIAASFIICLGFNSMIVFRNSVLYGFYYVVLIFCASWICDAAAYFLGTAFGKTKIAPSISPNKTVCGAVGGFAVTLICIAAVTVIFKFLIFKEMPLNFINLAVFSVLAPIIGMVGDLFASLLKRELKIKDYGYLIPGHGGILDRFDSFIFISVFMLVYTQPLSIIAG